jgi:glycosyltransferase involved in cell wall biosynthesis
VLTVLGRLRREGWTADVVHAHEYAAGVPATLAATMLRAPLVVSERSTALALGRLPARDLARARRVFRRAAAVCPDSHDLGRRIRPLTGGTPIRPVPNPVDTDLFVPTKRQRGEDVRLLVVGNLIPRKEHRRLIDALKLIVDAGSSVSLDVVGDGESRLALEDQARERGVQSRVRFHGHLDKPGVARMMQAADVLVLPSLWENLPCVLLEAMSTGLPVVATRVGGTDEIVDQSTGELVEPGSEDALARAIMRVANHRDAYDPAAMHQTAASRYGYVAVAQDLSEIYEFALGTQAGAAARSTRGAPLSQA